MFVEAAYRYRFYPTAEQADLLMRTFGCARFVYNRARAARDSAWTERRESIGYKQTSALLTEWKKDPELAWLNDVSCVPLQQALRHLDRAYGAFFKRIVRYPGFRHKDGKQSAEFTRNAFSYRHGVLRLAKMLDPLNVVWSRELPSEPRSLAVMREPDGRWYVSCRIIKRTAAFSDAGAVGIDLGLNHFATLSDGSKIDNPRHLRRRQKKLARLQRSLSRKKKGSKNRAKARIKVARAHSAVRHARQDFLHKLSTQIIRENQTVCIEDLNIKGMARGHLAKSIADAGWSDFVLQLRYKSLWYGRTLVKIDRFYPSTKTCGECGTTGHKLALSDREWMCPDCGVLHDRDENAARNILAAGLAVIACGETVSPLAA